MTFDSELEKPNPIGLEELHGRLWILLGAQTYDGAEAKLVEEGEVIGVRKTRPEDAIINHSEIQRRNEADFISGDRRRRESRSGRKREIAMVNDFDCLAHLAVVVGGGGGLAVVVVVQFHEKEMVERESGKGKVRFRREREGGRDWESRGMFG